MKTLFLEERIYIVRNALNEKSLVFQDVLPVEVRENFKQYVYDLLNVLDGFYFDDAKERLERK